MCHAHCVPRCVPSQTIVFTVIDFPQNVQHIVTLESQSTCRHVREHGQSRLARYRYVECVLDSQTHTCCITLLFYNLCCISDYIYNFKIILCVNACAGAKVITLICAHLLAVSACSRYLSELDTAGSQIAAHANETSTCPHTHSCCCHELCSSG